MFTTGKETFISRYILQHWYTCPIALPVRPVCLNMVSSVVRLSIRKRPSEFMNVTVWEHTFDNKTFGCGKVYYSNSIIITNFVQTLIPSCWFENRFPTDFGIEISSNIFMWYLVWNLSNTCSNSSLNLFFTSSILSSVGAWTFRTLSLQRPLNIM
jgi:hypothetical protein